MIYFMQAIDGGAVKIGTTEDLEARHRQLEQHYGVDLVILATMDGGREEEQALHARFSCLRFGRTEQFRPAAELMEFIGRPLLVSVNPAVVQAMPGRYTTLFVRVSDQYAEWLTEVAKFDRVTIAAFLDRAAADRAKAIGFNGAPPDRIP